MFLDEAVVEFESGRGGSGAVSFHREKHQPRLGPNGADGGRGGDVVLIADRNRRTLFDLRLQQKFKADDGGHGVGNKRGKDSKNIIVKIPVGTVIVNNETGQPIVDMSTHGMKFAIAKGGKGGFGNQHYTSSVRQVPNFAQKGAPGECITARMELKLLADVGLVGLPNAGKSTLISRISSAKPKIADYPFTTIIPNLGVVRYAQDTFVVADMPGLIEGASQGVGLGHQFLKHVERTKMLVHVVDMFPVDESDPIDNYHKIEMELKLYSEDIWNRPRIIALSKVDIVPHELYGSIRKRFEELGQPFFPISAVSGEGTEPLIRAMFDILEAAKTEPDIPVLMPALERLDNIPFKLEKTEEGYVVSGRRIERLVAMTDLENEGAVRYLHRRLDKLKVIEQLRELGAVEGDDVLIGKVSFAFTDNL